MTSYENALLAMERLLRRVGVPFWADWMLRDIQDWREQGDTSHHRSAYGGMGSFNDIWICQANQHSVTTEQEPWANELFDWIKAVLFYVVQSPDAVMTAEELARHVGRHSAALAAFVGGKTTPDSMRGFVSDRHPLQGWRCLACGHARIGTRDLDCFIAAKIIPTLIFQGCQGLDLELVVDRILALDIPHLSELRASFQTVVIASAIEFVHGETWVKPCPSCGRNDVAVYRWTLSLEPQPHFEPSGDNLPLLATSSPHTSPGSAAASPPTKRWWKFW